jgi:hypothetical protein
MTMRTWFPACFVSFVSLLTGCATSYPVNIDSMAKPGADEISYSLRNVSRTEKEDSLRYREAATYVRTALSGRGLYEAPKNVVPDVIVDIDFGISTEISREVVKVPVWKTEPSKVSPHGSVQGDTVVFDRAVFSLEERTIVNTTHNKYLHLVAHENITSTTGGPPAETWRVDVSSEGKSKDLRKYLPVLVAASIEYVGKDSRGQKSIQLKDTDADVVFVKKGM